MALSLALSLMLIVFVALQAFTLLVAAGSLRVENAWASTQALYAAEAATDIALQGDASRPIAGQCGRARYAAIARDGRVIAMGQVQRAAGAPIRRALEAERADGGGIVRGTWRPVPPARCTRLIALLQQAEERAQP
jgi:hypothetical protein